MKREIKHQDSSRHFKKRILLYLLPIIMCVMFNQKVEANIGNSLSIDANTRYAWAPSSESLNISGNRLTMEAWVKLSGETGNHWIICKQNIDRNRSFGFYVTSTDHNSQGLIIPSISADRHFEEPVGTQSLNYNVWYHVAVVYDGYKVKTFVNGIQDGEADLSGNIVHNAMGLTIGGTYWSPTDSTNGFIDEVRIWNIARSQSEISSSMNQILTGNEEGLIGYWRFESLEDINVNQDGFDDYRDIGPFANHIDLQLASDPLPSAFHNSSVCDLEYTVNIVDPGSHKATINMVVKNLETSEFSITEIFGPGGIGINVVSLNASKPDGSSLSVQHIEGDENLWESDKWIIYCSGSSIIKIEYIIEATKLTNPSDPLNTAYFGYINNSFGVLLGAYIFLLPEDYFSINSLSIRCVIFPGWKVITPWPVIDGVYFPLNVYEAQYFRSLFGDVLWCFGEFDTYSTKIAHDDVTIAVYKPWPVERKNTLIKNGSSIYAYQTSMLNSGMNKPWTIVFNPTADDGRWIYGGTSSLSMTFTAPDGIMLGWGDFATETAETRWTGYDWGFTGGTNCTWFYSGGGSLYGIKSEHNTLINDTASISGFFSNYLDYFIYPGKDIPLASLDLLPDYEYDMPRIKGVLATFLMAKEIYYRTNGSKNIDDLSRTFFQKYWATGYQINTEDFKNELELLTGSDFTQFFNSYVYGTEIYPIDWAFQDNDYDGLTNEVEIYLNTNPDISDTDFDGSIDSIDNCPLASNPSQYDSDIDGAGDICDCEGNTDADGDVDGSDLSNYARGDISVSLETLSADFGKIYCKY